MRLFVLSRHAHSALNLAHRVNGDPTVAVPLTDEGRSAAARLGEQLEPLPIELCVHTRFPRTRDTAIAALAGRDVRMVEEPLLDDIYVGDLEGVTIDEYRAWKAEHRRSDSFPNGESLDAAAARYAEAFLRLLDRPEEVVLVICHEIPVRYALNAARGSSDLDGPHHQIPNATPYLFDEASLARAASRVAELAHSIE